jgi:hypothetical protein
MEKLEAEITLKTVELMEGAKSKREALMHEYQKVEKEKNNAERDKSGPVLSEAQEQQGEVIGGSDLSGQHESEPEIRQEPEAETGVME